MAPAPKTPISGKEKDRRKSGGKPSMIRTFHVTPNKLRKILDPSSVKEESPAKDSLASPAPPSDATPARQASAAAAEPEASSNANGENASESTPGTPAPNGTPGQTPMGPPSEASKKKGVKRAAKDADPTAKIRGKPGPKKKPRLEDGTIDPTGKNGAYHKLGPKASMGAINAGLRALDRSGAPCRRWGKGGFRVKSFTGVVWEVNRWTAPQKSNPEATSEEASTASGENNSTKENKEEGQVKSDSNSHPGGEQPSIPPSVHASSPAPAAVAAAS